MQPSVESVLPGLCTMSAAYHSATVRLGMHSAEDIDRHRFPRAEVSFDDEKMQVQENFKTLARFFLRELCIEERRSAIMHSGQPCPALKTSRRALAAE